MRIVSTESPLILPCSKCIYNGTLFSFSHDDIIFLKTVATPFYLLKKLEFLWSYLRTLAQRNMKTFIECCMIYILVLSLTNKQLGFNLKINIIFISLGVQYCSYHALIYLSVAAGGQNSLNKVFKIWIIVVIFSNRNI